MSRFGLGKASRTFKPIKKIPKGTKQYELSQQALMTLGTGNLHLAVRLPEGVDLNEWLLVNTVDFYNQISMLYGALEESCTATSCPVMSAGPKAEYYWADGKDVKKAIRCSAKEYADYLLTWVKSLIDDEQVFPSSVGQSFPKNFKTLIATIFKRLFRIYAHIYHSHFPTIQELQFQTHLNTSFKHFIYFVDEFKLVKKKELSPMGELVEALLKKKIAASGGSAGSSSSTSSAAHDDDEEEEEEDEEEEA
ncbi:Mitotic exit network component [Balamuthia mandrillaris]